MVNIFDKVHNNKNDNIRGEYGEAVANLFFVQHGFRVSLVSGDWYPYDLVVERHGIKRTIQVKTATNKKNGRYFRAKFKLSYDFDDIFVLTAEGDIYVLPYEEAKFVKTGDSSELVLYPKYDRFKIGKFNGFEFQNTDQTINSLQDTLGVPN